MQNENSDTHSCCGGTECSDEVLPVLTDETENTDDTEKEAEVNLGCGCGCGCN